MGLPAGLSFCPQSQDESGVAAEEPSNFHQCRELALGESKSHPLNCKLWGVLKDLACRKRHSDLDSLKRSLAKAAAEIPLETVRAVTTERSERLKACVETEDGHFE